MLRHANQSLLDGNMSSDFVGGWRTLSEWKILFATQNYDLVDLKEVGASMHLMVWEKK